MPLVKLPACLCTVYREDIFLVNWNERGLRNVFSLNFNSLMGENKMYVFQGQSIYKRHGFN